MSARGGPRPGAGRPRRDPSALSTARPGPPMTDAEWAEVTAYAERVGVSPVEAMRRLIRAGLDSAAS